MLLRVTGYAMSYVTYVVNCLKKSTYLNLTIDAIWLCFRISILSYDEVKHRKRDSFSSESTNTTTWSFWCATCEIRTREDKGYHYFTYLVISMQVYIVMFNYLTFGFILIVVCYWQ